jgi:hypothetical protein
MAQPGLTPTEIASLEAALAANGIRIDWLHRWAWRRGWALPPAVLMSLPAFLLWQAVIFCVTTLPCFMLGLQMGRMPAALRNACVITLTIAVVMLVGWLLFRAIRLYGTGGIAWIEKLAVAGLIAVFWTLLTVIYLGHGDAMSAPNPLVAWVSLGSFIGTQTMVSLGIRNSYRQKYRETWRDYWHGIAKLEAF